MFFHSPTVAYWSEVIGKAKSLIYLESSIFQTISFSSRDESTCKEMALVQKFSSLSIHRTVVRFLISTKVLSTISKKIQKQFHHLFPILSVDGIYSISFCKESFFIFDFLLQKNLVLSKSFQFISLFRIVETSSNCE
jgi:hypothetical protein